MNLSLRAGESSRGYEALPEPVMFIITKKSNRKLNRNKTKRYRARLKAKNAARRDRVYGRA